MFATLAIFAQVVAPSVDPGADPIAWALNAIKWVIEQFQAHNYAPAVGGLIMLLVFGLRKAIGNKISAKALPWVSMLLGVLVEVGSKLTELVAGFSIMQLIGAIVSGAMIGLSASGMWSAFGKPAAEKLNPPQDPPAA